MPTKVPSTMLAPGGSAGQVLTSMGGASSPTWQTPAAAAGNRPAITNFGAVGDGVTDSTAAIQAAESTGGTFFVPDGLYIDSNPSTSLSASYQGDGQIKTAGNKRGKFFSAVKVAPSSIGNFGSVETAFNGDLSKVPFAVEHRITGAGTLGTPSSGYLYTPEAFPHFTYLTNASGWNQSTSSNDGRTGCAAYFTRVEQNGQGDAMAYIASVEINSTKAGSTDFLANPAGALFAGDVASSVAGAYLNPTEFNLVDNGNDCAGVGAVYNLWRNNDTGAKKAFWNGVRVQSNGTKAINAGFALTGKANTGLDFTRSTLTNTGGIKPAILLKDGDCIMGAATPGTGYGDFTPGSALITYTAASGWVMQVAGNPTLQVSSAQALVKGDFLVNPTGAGNRLSVSDSITQVGNAFSHSGSTFGVFGATPAVQYPGWGTPTGFSLVSNFPGAGASLAECGNAIGSIIAYMKAVGFFAA